MACMHAISRTNPNLSVPVNQSIDIHRAIAMAMAAVRSRSSCSRFASLRRVLDWPSSASATIPAAAPWSGEKLLVLQTQQTQQTRFASNQIVRARMKSVNNIKKITMAMKMVAASKLRTTQVKAENSRGLWQPFTALLGDAPAIQANKKLVLVLSSDKGLCGGINSTSVKYARSLHRMQKAGGDGKDIKFALIGDKGKSQLQREFSKSFTTFITETQKEGITFTQCALIADEIIKNNKYDVLHLVYNKFESAVSFLPTVATILSPAMFETEEGQKVCKISNYEIEEDENMSDVLTNLTEFQLASVLYNAMLENATSEMGARMSAMDNSTRNAGDVLARLTLSYNRSRQAAITTELIEIISGAAALEG